METHTSDPKIPQTQYPVMPAITARWSPRSFSDRMISLAELSTLVEAATWAPSSTNEQPWQYIYAFKGSPEFSQYFDFLAQGNKFWADKASVMLLSLARKTFSSNGNPNRHAMYDVGAANTQLLLQGASMGIYGHQMGGFDMEAARKALQVPEHLEIACIMALGYLDAPEKLEEPFRSRELAPRSRKPVSEVLLDKPNW